jgi:pilus assembly protein Flp/PilA
MLMHTIIKRVRSFFEEDEGATAIEYGLIAALVSIAIVAVLGFVGDELYATFEEIRAALAGRGSPGG